MEQTLPLSLADLNLSLQNFSWNNVHLNLEVLRTHGVQTNHAIINFSEKTILTEEIFINNSPYFKLLGSLLSTGSSYQVVRSALLFNKIFNKEQVTKLLFNNNKYNIYMLSHAYLSGNLEQAIIIFNQIYTGVEDAILISWIILEDVRKLLKIKNAIKNNITLHNIFYELKIIKDNIQAFTLANSRISYNQILELYQDLSIIDLAIKGLMPNLNIHTKFLEIISKISCNTTIFPDK